MTKAEFAQAFRAVQRLGRKWGEGRVMEAVIFRCLRVVLLEDSRFGEKADKPIPQFRLPADWEPAVEPPNRR